MTLKKDTFVTGARGVGSGYHVKDHFQPNSEFPFREGGGSENKCDEFPFFGDIELLTLSLI